jgi:hypothetical protein
MAWPLVWLDIRSTGAGDQPDRTSGQDSTGLPRPTTKRPAGKRARAGSEVAAEIAANRAFLGRT